MMHFITAMVVLTSAVAASDPNDYASAYNAAMENDRPLLVLVTAKWCPPCQSLKQHTLPGLLENGSLDDVNFAMVDLDAEGPLARDLIGDQPIPQFILFEKQDGVWVKKRLIGFQTIAGVQHFVRPAVAQLGPEVEPEPAQTAQTQR